MSQAAEARDHAPPDRHDRPNIPLLPEVTPGPQPADQPGLKLASEGVQRDVWYSAYGAMLIEVRGQVVYVNGQRVTSIRELRTDRSQV